MYSVNDLYVPQSVDFAEVDTWRWYSNVEHELTLLNLTPTEKQHMGSYYRNAGLLNGRRSAFFRHHYSSSFYRASRFLIQGCPDRVIVDLGAGTGTQSLFFACLGARVYSVDMDSLALEVLAKRQIQYEQLLGRPLALEIIRGDVFELDWSVIPVIDGVYSMFAFNMMQPSDKLLDKIAARVAPGGRLAVIDGNNSSWLPFLVRSRRRDVLSPMQFRKALEARGFRVCAHHGGVALPPVVWSWARAKKQLEVLDHWLCKTWWFSISHQILAERIQRNEVDR